jgi:CBS domain-containing protein
MKVSEVMTKNPACCTSDASLQEVAKMMVDNDCGAIPVVENQNQKKPIGIITDRDITVRTVAEGKNPLDLTARDAMTSSVVTVRENSSANDCFNLMEDKQIRRVAVVDENGACCGIVAQADVAQKASKGETAELIKEVSE